MTWVGHQERSGGISSTSVSFTPSSIAGIQEGDCMVAVIYVDYDDSSITQPAGWTFRKETPSATYLVAYTKFHEGGSEPASAQFTFGGSGRYIASLSAIRGVDPASPVLASSANNSLTAAGVTAAECELFFVCGVVSSSSGGITVPTGMTERFDFSGATTRYHEGATEAWAGGATGDRTAVRASASDSASMLLALGPEPADIIGQGVPTGLELATFTHSLVPR